MKARTKCRSVELILLSYLEQLSNKIIGIYFNRLSDYLFVSARYVNFISKVDDIVIKIDKS